MDKKELDLAFFRNCVEDLLAISAPKIAPLVVSEIIGKETSSHIFSDYIIHHKKEVFAIKDFVSEEYSISIQLK